MIFYPRYLFAAGFTPLPWLMFIRKDCKGDEPLHQHEKVHQRQMREDGTIVFWVKYLFSRKCRMKYEIEAYKCQIANGASLDGCARNLASMYYLGITFGQAKELLK
jgi:hypothetical protein